jgi:hypothetical protein
VPIEWCSRARRARAAPQARDRLEADIKDKSDALSLEQVGQE